MDFIYTFPLSFEVEGEGETRVRLINKLRTGVRG